MNFHGRLALGVALTAILATGTALASCSAATDVLGMAVPTDSGTWTYSLSVANGCAFNNQPFLTDFYIPYFVDDDITNIMLPPPDTTTTTSTITWTDTIEPDNDLFGLADAGVIDFEVTATPELEASATVDAPGVGYYFASGFSFTSTFAPVDGPYAILQYLPPDYDTTTTLFGDPSIPGSPDTIAALNTAAAPEPAAAGLLVAGLCVMIVNLKRRVQH